MPRFARPDRYTGGNEYEFAQRARVAVRHGLEVLMAMDALERVMAEYRQWPGLRLTKRQAAKLWWMSPRETDAVFEALVGCGVLYIDAHGQYALRSPPRPERRKTERRARDRQSVSHAS